MKVTKTRFANGVWQGLVTDAPSQPDLRVTHLDRDVPDVTVAPDAGDKGWLLQIPIPKDAISDGLQTLLITDKNSGETLEHITIVAGEALSENLRAEVDLLRAELDMLKQAFRRHCRDTA